MFLCFLWRSPQIKAQIAEASAVAPAKDAAELEVPVTLNGELNVLAGLERYALYALHAELGAPGAVKGAVDIATDLEPDVLLAKGIADKGQDVLRKAGALRVVHGGRKFGDKLVALGCQALAGAASACLVDGLEFFSKGGLGLALDFGVLRDPVVQGRDWGREPVTGRQES